MKRQLDVAGELAVVVDVARSAVCAARQLVECTDHQLGAATARTQQVPAQLEQPLRDRLQAHLDDVALVLAPLTGQRHRPDAHEIDLLRGRDPAAQPATEAVAVGGPVDARRHRVEPGVGRSREPRRRLEGCLAAPCRPVTGGVGEAGEDAPCDPKENGSQGEGAEQVGSRGLDLVVAEGAAAAVGLEAQRRAQAVDWAPGEHAEMAKPLAIDPLHRDLFPGNANRSPARLGEEAHRAVRLRHLLDRVFGDAGGLVELGRIGERRPQRLGRLVEAPLERPAVDFGHTSDPRYWAR